MSGRFTQSGSFDIWASQSPDGRYVIIGGVLSDRHGHQLGQVPWPGKDASVTWSPDSQLMCKALPVNALTGAAMRLDVASPGQSARTIAHGYATYSDNASYPVLACDPTRDRVIVGEFGQGIAPNGLWVIRISTGAVIRSIRSPMGWPVASADASLLALATSPAGGTPTTSIEQADDGQIIGTIEDFHAQGFSGDSSILVGIAGQKGAVTLVNWRTKHRIWTTPGPYGGYLSEPNSARMAIGIGFLGGSDQADVYLVNPDGTVILLPEHLRTALLY